MKVAEILQYIPKEKFAFLAQGYQVDHQVKKLNGEVMFYLLLFSMLNGRQTSLRTLETFYSSPQFRNILNKELKPVKYNSISDRLRTINSNYFESIFKIIFEKYQKNYLKSKDNIISFDSTVFHYPLNY